MDQAILRRTNARHLPEVEKVQVKGFNDRQLKTVQKLGGFGDHKDKNGKWVRSVRAYYDPEQKTKKLQIFEPAKQRSHKRNLAEQEYQRGLEEIQEFEASGRHPRVKPSRAKRVKKQLKDWVDGDRPVQGVDV